MIIRKREEKRKIVGWLHQTENEENMEKYHKETNKDLKKLESENIPQRLQEEWEELNEITWKNRKHEQKEGI